MKGPDTETTDDSVQEPGLASPQLPALIVVSKGGKPAAECLLLERNALELGRAEQQSLFEGDDHASRRHCRVERHDGTFRIIDLESRNGTFVNGQQVSGAVSVPDGAVIRVGRTLLWAVLDSRPYLGRTVSTRDGLVLGGRMQTTWLQIELAAQSGSTLHLRGESGSGKELAARAFHEARRGTAAAFVAVNCAAIPEGLAERLLFGVRRGAYSGAANDAEGFVQSANGGTLFLDEIAELDAKVQAKLLRVLETREVLPLGANRPQAVKFAICTATHRDLRGQVQTGAFREDLYYRIGRPMVTLPPLRARRDEIPWLVQQELAAAANAHGRELSATPRLIEVCLLRPWPGNVREFLAEVRQAAHAALHAGRALVDADDLAPDAGLELGGSEEGEARTTATTATPRSDAEIERALADHAGNVTATARALGMHRNQLRRWLAKR